MNEAMARAKSLAGGFTPGQRGIILVALAALVMGAIALTNWVAQPTWTPLFSQLSGSDASSIVEELRSQNVQYQLADGGSTVLVPQSQGYDLRVTMSGKGLPSDSGDGWAILDKQGMTATEFQQNTAYQRALEAELDKTLASISGVNTAIVHLTIPKRDVFASEQDTPTAAVLLALAPGTTLSKGQVRSVTHLVAGSVPGLDPDKVTVSDSNGTMLTAPDGAAGVGGSASLAGDADGQTALFEDRVAEKTQRMLDTVLGAGRAVVQVSADLDFDSRHSTTESYLPSPVVPLSEQTTLETYNNASGAAGGQLGVVTPTPVSSLGGDGNYLRQGSTVNNGAGKTIVEEEAAPGTVQRLSVAVVIDSDTPGGADITKVQGLVSRAVGIDSARGDVVQVEALPFDKTASQAAAEELASAEQTAKVSGYIDLGKKAGLGLLAVIVAIVLLRRRRSDGSATVDASASDLAGGLLVPSRLEALANERMRELGAAAGRSSATEPAGMLEASPTIEREKLRDEVSTFVDSQPEGIAQLVQGWLSERGS